MASDIWIDSLSPDESLVCVVEGDGVGVWMYLHDAQHIDDPSEKSVIATSPICSQVELISLAEFKESYRGKDAPPLVHEYSTNQAVRADLTNERLELIWSDDSRSVVALVDGEPHSLIVAGDRKGHSKSLSHDGPWGHPWNNEIFNRLFGPST